MSLAGLLLAVAAAGPTVEDLSWMSGYWLSCDTNREVSETWSDPRGDLMVGHGVAVAGGRVSFEALRIAPHAEGVAYVAQPGGAPATIFPAVEVGPGRAVFENPAHDFPTRIVYEREGEILSARIEGESDGRPVSMGWRFRSAELNARCPD